MTTKCPLFSRVLATVLLVGAVSAQVTLERGAVVYHGSMANTTAPATIDDEKVRVVTLEWQTIESEGIGLESARGRLLVQKMNQRVREAVRAVASEEGRDLVVRDNDIADHHGREIVDLTDEVISKLEER